jgi:hypothetical protein
MTCIKDYLGHSYRFSSPNSIQRNTILSAAKASIQTSDITRRSTNTMSPEQHAALVAALRAIEIKVDDAVKAAQGFEPRCIDTVKPAIAAPTPTTTTASTTANEPLKIDNTTHESFHQPVELDGTPVPSPPETNAIKPYDTTEQNTNAIMDDKMSDNEESDNGESSHDTGRHKRDYRDPLSTAVTENLATITVAEPRALRCIEAELTAIRAREVILIEEYDRKPWIAQRAKVWRRGDFDWWFEKYFWHPILLLVAMALFMSYLQDPPGSGFWAVFQRLWAAC